MKNRGRTTFWGFFIIILGLLFLANNLDIFEGSIFFAGWWTVFIIVPSVAGLFYKEEVLPSILGIMIGVLLLLAAQNYLAWEMVGKIFIPFVIICVGVSILLKPKFNSRVKRNHNGKVEYIGIFGGVEEKITDKFIGGSSVAVFGGVVLDLRDAIIEEDIMIECFTVFGGTEIYLPKNVIVKTKGVSIFGGAENHFKEQKTKKQPIIYVNHVTILGGIELK